jgi:hypothetical protein
VDANVAGWNRRIGLGEGVNCRKGANQKQEDAVRTPAHEVRGTDAEGHDYSSKKVDALVSFGAFVRRSLGGAHSSGGDSTSAEHPVSRHLGNQLHFLGISGGLQ